MAKNNPFRTRSVRAKLLKMPTSAERRYVLDLTRLAKQVQARYMSYLEPHLAEHALKQDGLTKRGLGLDAIDRQTAKDLEIEAGPLFDRMAKQIKIANARAQRLLGIDYEDIGLSAKVAGFREQNIMLIVRAGRAYAQTVRDVFEDPQNVGLTPAELKQRLLDRGDVWESRAQLIARDQTLKLNGQITQTRQTSAGVTKYIWSTSLDERVRQPTHTEKEGKVFEWAFPPPDTGHPGQDYQCRCVALPVTADQE